MTIFVLGKISDIYDKKISNVSGSRCDMHGGFGAGAR